jgi:hypothetical protein
MNSGYWLVVSIPLALLSLYFSLTLSTKGSLDLCGSSNRLAMSTLGLPGRGRRNQEKPTSRCSPSRALYVCDPSMFLCVQPQRHYPVRGPLRARAATVSRCTACMPYPAATWLPARLPAACHQRLFSFLFPRRCHASPLLRRALPAPPCNCTVQPATTGEAQRRPPILLDLPGHCS